MRRRDPLEEDGRLWRVDVEVDPAAPSPESCLKSNRPVHVLVQLLSHLNIVPPAKKEKRKKGNKKKGWKRKSELVTLQWVIDYDLCSWRVDARLSWSPAVPPMPSVEDEHVCIFPELASEDRVQFQDPANVFSHHVYEEHISIQHNLHSIILQ